MSMVSINWEPTEKQLKQFGVLLLVGLPFIAWMFTGRPGMGAEWTPFHTKLIGGLALIGGIGMIVGFIAPKALKPVFIGLSLVAFPIGLVVSNIIVALMFYVIFTPVGLIFKAIGRDALDRSIDRSAKSYWQPKAQTTDVSRYFRQS